MFLVTGATGNAGGAVVDALRANGAQVRALVREPGRADLPPDVELVQGDLNDARALDAAASGVTAAFLLSGYDGLDEGLVRMRRAGVQRVVLLSSSAAPSGDIDNAVARYHIVSERAVQDSGLAWTFLQPNSFMTNTFQWIPQLREGDVIRAPFADVAIATIDPQDVGAVAAKALRSDELEGRSLRLSGPQALYPVRQGAESRVRARPGTSL